MKYLRNMSILILLVLLGSTSVFAETPKPYIPKGNAEKCVEPTADMRKNHMKYILHHRDETMHEGIRTSKHSLKACINCHVVKDDTGTPVNYKSDKHFCNSCHHYASVQIDCFDCHASTPGQTGETASMIDSVSRVSAAGGKE